MLFSNYNTEFGIKRIHSSETLPIVAHTIKTWRNSDSEDDDCTRKKKKLKLFTLSNLHSMLCLIWFPRSPWRGVSTHRDDTNYLNWRGFWFCTMNVNITRCFIEDVNKSRQHFGSNLLNQHFNFELSPVRFSDCQTD